MATTFGNALFPSIGPTATVTTTATSSTSSGIVLTSIVGLIPGMPITFSGVTAFGGITLNQQYYITAINSTNSSVTVSIQSGGSNITTVTGTGSLTATIVGATTIISSAANARITVVGLTLTNTTPNLVQATVYLIDGTSNNKAASYAYGITIPANQSLKLINGGEKLVLGPSMSVNVTSSIASSIDCVGSYVTIQ
jgi:hypothetical protein